MAFPSSPNLDDDELSDYQLELKENFATALPELIDVPSSPVVGFSDADWLPKASDGEQMKSTSGHCVVSMYLAT